MKLTKIKYTSAAFFGISTFILYLVVGVIQLITYLSSPNIAVQLGYVSAVSSLITVPLTGGLIAYIFTIAAICLYNFVAKTYPIAWEVKK
jgi:putative flippase GtrA